MNRENLKKIRDFLKDLPQEGFDMGTYTKRKGTKKASCKSPGCVLGWIPAIFPEQAKKMRQGSKSPMFEAIGEKVMGIHDHELNWVCSIDWTKYDNTPVGAAKRIQYLLDGGQLPKEYKDVVYHYNPDLRVFVSVYSGIEP